MDADIFRETIDLRDMAEKVDADVAIFLDAQATEAAAARRKETAKARLMRACCVYDGEDVASHTTGITNNYEIVLKKGTAHHIAREAQTIDTLRFDIRKRK